MKSIKKIFGTLLILGIVTTFATSCKKYDEGGPLRNAEDIIPKEWSMEKAYKNDVSVEKVSDNPQIGEVTEDMTFKSDGTMSREKSSGKISGTWKLVNKNKQIEITITSPTDEASTITYDIMKLTEGNDGEFIWEHDYNGNHYRYESRSSS
ncbi:MAG: hypothetical protein JKY33_04620 [Bacteroidia bacterium]|nr:hypothetical protein [Bacteroidia bacterium]